MQAGIIGLPGCGKTTVFRALTGLSSGAESGAKSKLVRGVVKVPDERLDELARRYHPRKVTHAEVVFTDLPGPGHGDGSETPHSIPPRFVGDMRAMDLLVHVVRGFTNLAGEPPDPAGDLADLIDEMILADLAVVEKRLTRLHKGEKEGFASEQEALKRIADGLQSSRTVASVDLDPATRARLSGYAFLTAKPQAIVLNLEDEASGEETDGAFSRHASSHAQTVFSMAARLEMELGELDDEERRDFMSEMGIEMAGTDRFIRQIYGDLGLISFFTTGEDEVRAWTVKEGTTALRAAGKIHTDLERGFIRADVVTYDDLVEMGDEAACKKTGRLRQEGKEYAVKDGDILTVRFNV